MLAGQPCQGSLGHGAWVGHHCSNCLDKPHPTLLLLCPLLKNYFLLPSKLLCTEEGKPLLPTSYPQHAMPALGECLSQEFLSHHRGPALALTTSSMALHLVCNRGVSLCVLTRALSQPPAPLSTLGSCPDCTGQPLSHSQPWAFQQGCSHQIQGAIFSFP